MPRKQFKRAVRSSPLTPEEAAREKDRRQKIMAEFPPLETREPEPGGISDSLRTAIKESPKSVYQICQDAGISQIVVSRFLSGQRDIRLATADRLARALGLAVAADNR
jgi:DNA-binding phage protein